MNYIAGININIKKHKKAIKSIQVIIEILVIVLFFFKTPIITPKIPITNSINNIIVKLNFSPPIFEYIKAQYTTNII